MPDQFRLFRLCRHDLSKSFRVVVHLSPSLLRQHEKRSKVETISGPASEECKTGRSRQSVGVRPALSLRDFLSPGMVRQAGPHGGCHYAGPALELHGYGAYK